MKILITGGTGHLGSALVHHLVRERGLSPADLRIFYLAGTPTRALADIRGIELCPGDLLDFESIRQACRGVDLVFHLAASTSFDPRRKSIQWRTNVEGTRHVLEAARLSPTIRRICYTSTVNVLAAPDPPGSIGTIETCDPYSGRARLHTFHSSSEALEFAAFAGSGAPGWEKRIGIGYFDSKLAAQEIVDHYVHEHGLDIVSVLPGTLFGPYDALIGSGIFLLSIYRRKLPGVLAGGISTVHVMDAAEGHRLAMDKGKRGGRWILTGPEENNLYFRDLAGIIAEVLRRRFPNRRIRRRYPIIPRWAAYGAAEIAEIAARLSRRPGRLSRAVVRAGSRALFYSPEDSIRELGYRPRRSFREAVEEMTEYYQAMGLFSARGRRIDHGA